MSQCGIYRNPAQKGHLEISGHFFAAFACEHINPLIAVRTGKSTHIFNHSQDRQIQLPAKCDAFFHIDYSELLGGSDNDSPVNSTKELHDRERLAARKRRRATT